ncbi:hypothetical protein L484_017233 [Morus notabilis]|uniref:Uncharacterized protein n=1 Tax=Morus notabilis TaxID=981085 RepID=W9RFI5_9ROSA|nr:hypothetical protein L484_017233 [Morus notabilis]
MMGSRLGNNGSCGRSQRWPSPSVRGSTMGSGGNRADDGCDIWNEAERRRLSLHLLYDEYRQRTSSRVDSPAISPISSRDPFIEAESVGILARQS